MTAEQRPAPVYRGMKKYFRPDGGFAIWLPSDWRQIDMTEDHMGAIFTPYEDHYDTCIAVEKHILPYKVVRGDISTLRKGMEEGLQSLPEIEIEMLKDEVTSTLIFLDTKYSFLENGLRRKRWLRNIYWGEAQLVLLAQGMTVEDYDYWMPMFFNCLMTPEVGVML
jgi:hypothetical protein